MEKKDEIGKKKRIAEENVYKSFFNKKRFFFF